MDADELKTVFDRQAPGYDQQWSRLAAFREGMQILIGAAFRELPADARVLCVGAGTGAEIESMAARFPQWTFAAVEPSPGMLAECRRRMDARGLAGRCSFHEGYVETLPPSPPFDAATALLVSQFILQRPARVAFFDAIARRLRPGALLASADLSADTAAPGYEGLLELWMRTLAVADPAPDRLRQMREAYERDVAVLAPAEMEALIRDGGFEEPTAFFQAGLMRAWTARRSAGVSGA